MQIKQKFDGNAQARYNRSRVGLVGKYWNMHASDHKMWTIGEEVVWLRQGMVEECKSNCSDGERCNLCHNENATRDSEAAEKHQNLVQYVQGMGISEWQQNMLDGSQG